MIVRIYSITLDCMKSADRKFTPAKFLALPESSVRENLVPAAVFTDYTDIHSDSPYPLANNCSISVWPRLGHGYGITPSGHSSGLRGFSSLWSHCESHHIARINGYGER